MFFRRKPVKVLTFRDRIDQLQQAGFAVETAPDGSVRASKHGVGALVGDEGKGQAAIEKAGVLVGGEMATLLNVCYQMLLETPNGNRFPAQAEQLRALHQFEDDAKDALGLTNLYNTSLGTTSRKHMYDRVTQRDAGQQPKPWEKKERRIAPPDTKGNVPT